MKVCGVGVVNLCSVPRVGNFVFGRCERCVLPLPPDPADELCPGLWVGPVFFKGVRTALIPGCQQRVSFGRHKGIDFRWKGRGSPHLSVGQGGVGIQYVDPDKRWGPSICDQGGGGQIKSHQKDWWYPGVVEQAVGEVDA
eukprot:591570-Hanusia_phi.AAC.1